MVIDKSSTVEHNEKFGQVRGLKNFYFVHTKDYRHVLCFKMQVGAGCINLLEENDQDPASESQVPGSIETVVQESSENCDSEALLNCKTSDSAMLETTDASAGVSSFETMALSKAQSCDRAEDGKSVEVILAPALPVTFPVLTEGLSKKWEPCANDSSNTNTMKPIFIDLQNHHTLHNK